RIANALRRSGRLQEALTRSEAAVSEIEKLRASVANPGLRTSYFASAGQQYELLIDVLMQLDQKTGDHSFGARAFQASERSRARALLESIAATQVSISTGVDPKLLERASALRALLDSRAEYYTQLLSSKADRKLLTTLSDEIGRLTSET